MCPPPGWYWILIHVSCLLLSFCMCSYSSAGLSQWQGSQGVPDQASGRADPTDQFLLWLIWPAGFWHDLTQSLFVTQWLAQAYWKLIRSTSWWQHVWHVSFPCLYLFRDSKHLQANTSCCLLPLAEGRGHRGVPQPGVVTPLFTSPG